MSDYLLGADVSSHQENWAGLADDEYYGWVKATEGRSYVNPEHDHQVSMIRNAGKVVGHYHWISPGGYIDDQVDYFFANSGWEPGDMIALDWEETGVSCVEKDQWIRSAQAIVAGASKVGLYCNRDFWFNRDTTSFAGDYLWIAVYTADPDPGIEYDWLFWQYTSTPYDKNRGRFDDLAALKEWAGCGTDPPPTQGLWYSTDYLYPQVKPDPANPNKIINGDHVEVTAEALKARQLPGGPQSLDKNGDLLVREAGYTFDVTGDLVDGWVTGGTNWYSSDYLIKEAAPTKPGWKTTPRMIIENADSDYTQSVSYLQDGNRVAAVDDEPEVWIIAQDYGNTGEATRFGAFDTKTGTLINGMAVKDGGHAQTFHAYRSAAGNLYIWTLIGDYAYRIKWQPGKTVSASSSGVEKMAFGTARPVGSYEHFVGFRSATDTKETLTIHDRFGFTDPENNSDDPLKSITITKRDGYTQQSWAVSEDRVYRLYGKTNETCGSTSGKHVLDVFDWNGKLLLDRFDIRNMYRSGADENEPEGISFGGEPGSVLVGMREGPASATKRSYVWWEMQGLP